MLCTATSAGSRKPCRAYARPGTTVCKDHGGSAPQVLRKAEERMTLAQLLQGDPRPLGEVLIDATHTADALMRTYKARVLAGETLDADLLTRLVEATARAHHLAETTARLGVHVELVKQAQLQRQLDDAYITHTLGRVLNALTGRYGVLRPLGEEYVEELRLWLHGVIGRELAAIETPDARTLDPEGVIELTSRPVTHDPPPALPGPPPGREEDR
jgi:hypothetical protein